MSVASTFPAPSRFSQFYALTKPRVVQLIVFCALIGMVLAVPGLPTLAQLGQMALASAGVWLVAGAAAAFNCIVEQGIDAKMKRTLQAQRSTSRQFGISFIVAPRQKSQFLRNAATGSGSGERRAG